MPIFLEPPKHKPRGPDGLGWNRLSLVAMEPRPQCALRPRTYAALVEAMDTARARYGGFAPCDRDGNCQACPRWKADLAILKAFTDRILCRYDPGGDFVHLMNYPEKGWSSRSQVWAWEDLARLPDWIPDGEHLDEHGPAFWLRRSP